LLPQKLATGEVSDWTAQSSHADKLDTRRTIDLLHQEVQARHA
jgi:hypothetical protein